MTQSLIHLPQHHAVGPHGLGSRLQQPVPPLAISRCASGKGAYIFVLGYRTRLVRRWPCEYFGRRVEYAHVNRGRRLLLQHEVLMATDIDLVFDVSAGQSLF